ncbi:unnamed protein product [Didymodactylos carnosus]|uniref:Uncharacterized protein n=1 Tax=Didymodactylos carnosus TaxID=1234261 RepID=A0A8S2JL34_9BILA|nr:unnamed protein product [Didymodactylos carnosus]CAF3812872.1 unnamed protein product [Didymodactylos carnosus]
MFIDGLDNEDEDNDYDLETNDYVEYNPLYFWQQQQTQLKSLRDGTGRGPYGTRRDGTGRDEVLTGRDETGRDEVLTGRDGTGRQKILSRAPL